MRSATACSSSTSTSTSSTACSSGRWLWSARRRALAEFRRSDYLGDPRSCRSPTPCALASSSATGGVPTARSGCSPTCATSAIVFNPVSFYYCFDADGAQRSTWIVAEITNTPWRERHAYVLPVEDARAPRQRRCTGRSTRPSTSRRSCRWTAATTGASPRRATTCACTCACSTAAAQEFDATLALRRRPLDAASLARVLLRYPLMTAAGRRRHPLAGAAAVAEARARSTTILDTRSGTTRMNESRPTP